MAPIYSEQGMLMDGSPSQQPQSTHPNQVIYPQSSTDPRLESSGMFNTSNLFLDNYPLSPYITTASPSLPIFTTASAPQAPVLSPEAGHFSPFNQALDVDPVFDSYGGQLNYQPVLPFMTTIPPQWHNFPESSQSQHPYSQMPTAIASSSPPVSPSSASTTHGEPMTRQMSMQSTSSHQSDESERTNSSDQDKKLCELCQKQVRDLKAHLETHKEVRTYRCCVKSCEYNKIGFARKNDAKRHQVTTHYRAELLCGFCEHRDNNVFNFRKHLQNIHDVKARQRTKKKELSPDSPLGDSQPCSCCKSPMSSPQAYHDHIEDCIKRHVENLSPSEAINEQHIMSVADDENVLETLERNEVSTAIGGEDEDNEEKFRSGKNTKPGANAAAGSFRNPNKVTKKSGMMAGSKHGGRLHGGRNNGAGSKKNANKPAEWGVDPQLMNVKRRTACGFDGPNRLFKDELAMRNDYAVEIPELGGITDLDYHTMMRATGFHGATPEERGPFDLDDQTFAELISASVSQSVSPVPFLSQPPFGFMP